MQPNQGQHLTVPGVATPVINPTAKENRPISQTPTSIKYSKLPDYMPDWKSPEYMNFEEASFAGCQLLAQMVFSASRDDPNKMFLMRTEFNEEGPPGIAHYCLGWA